MLKMQQVEIDEYMYKNHGAYRSTVTDYKWIQIGLPDDPLTNWICSYSQTSHLTVEKGKPLQYMVRFYDGVVTVYRAEEIFGQT